MYITRRLSNESEVRREWYPDNTVFGFQYGKDTWKVASPEDLVSKDEGWKACRSDIRIPNKPLFYRYTPNGLIEYKCGDSKVITLECWDRGFDRWYNQVVNEYING